jgi:hypothetical protein
VLAQKHAPDVLAVEQVAVIVARAKRYAQDRGRAGAMIDYVIAGVLLIIMVLVLILLRNRERRGR